MLHLTFDRTGKKVNCRYGFGFTIIELLIVISILGITATVVTTSYLGYERRERVKSGALEIKNQIRAAQNKALSGDKGFGTDPCPETSELVGWYVTVDESSNTTVEINGDCSDGINETNFFSKTVGLPKDVSISDVKYGSNAGLAAANILFRPTDNEAKFFNASTPPFLTGDDINEMELLGGLPQEPVTIALEITGLSTKYEVVILSTGSVYEKKI